MSKNNIIIWEASLPAIKSPESYFVYKFQFRIWFIVPLFYFACTKEILGSLLFLLMEISVSKLAAVKIYYMWFSILTIHFQSPLEASRQLQWLSKPTALLCLSTECWRVHRFCEQTTYSVNSWSKLCQQARIWIITFCCIN